MLPLCWTALHFKQLHVACDGLGYLAHSLNYLILQSKDEEYIEMLIASEEEERKHSRQMIKEEVQREKNIKLKNKEALIDELVRIIYKVKKKVIFLSFETICYNHPKI